AGRLAPGWLPSSITLATPAARRGAMDLSSSPSSALMTAVALLISPSQKNGSRGAFWAVEAAGWAGCATAPIAGNDRASARPSEERECLMKFSLYGKANSVSGPGAHRGSMALGALLSSPQGEYA